MLVAVKKPAAAIRGVVIAPVEVQASAVSCVRSRRAQARFVALALRYEEHHAQDGSVRKRLALQYTSTSRRVTLRSLVQRHEPLDDDDDDDVVPLCLAQT